MSVRVEWMSAKSFTADLLAPGEDWVGSTEQGSAYVLAISGDEVAAVYGTREEIEQVVRELYAEVLGHDPIGHDDIIEAMQHLGLGHVADDLLAELEPSDG